jgi:hypothetical protein
MTEQHRHTLLIYGGGAGGPAPGARRSRPVFGLQKMLRKCGRSGGTAISRSRLGGASASQQAVDLVDYILQPASRSPAQARAQAGQETPEKFTGNRRNVGAATPCRSAPSRTA